MLILRESLQQKELLRSILIKNNQSFLKNWETALETLILTMFACFTSSQLRRLPNMWFFQSLSLTLRFFGVFCKIYKGHPCNRFFPNISQCLWTLYTSSTFDEWIHLIYVKQIKEQFNHYKKFWEKIDRWSQILEWNTIYTQKIHI